MIWVAIGLALIVIIAVLTWLVRGAPRKGRSLRFTRLHQAESSTGQTEPELLIKDKGHRKVNSGANVLAEKIQVCELEAASRVGEEAATESQRGTRSVPAIEDGNSEATGTYLEIVLSGSSKSHGNPDAAAVDSRLETDSDASSQNTIAETDFATLSSPFDSGELRSKTVDQDEFRVSAADLPQGVTEPVDSADPPPDDVSIPSDSSREANDTCSESLSGLGGDETPHTSKTTSAAELELPSSLKLELEVDDVDTESNLEEVEDEEEEEEREEEDVTRSPREPRPPRRYRPAPRTPLTPRPSSVDTGNAADVRTRALSVAVRLSFRPGGVCEWSLLAQRSDGLPSELEVNRSKGTELFVALQEDWYELTSPADLSGLLLHGAAWTVTGTTAPPARWTLAPRDIYVLGHGADFAGYITAPRLVIGEEHAILYVADRRQSVFNALAVAGCDNIAEVDPADGVPEGWTLLKHVRPTNPVPAANDGGILESLRPLANVEIVLQGGIQVDRGEWLHGHPPTIRLRGDIASAGTVLVDGQQATIGEQGSCDAPDRGSLGEHSVWTASTNRTYRIVEGLESWETWPAHDFPGGVICGSGVYPPRAAGPGARAVIVAAREAVLIGAKPGQIHYCSPKNAWRSPVNIVFPTFEPVWSIPRFPLRCDKRGARVVLVSHVAPVSVHLTPHPRKLAHGIREWCRLVLDADRRGLRLSPSEDRVEALWEEFALVAREIWRHIR